MKEEKDKLSGKTDDSTGHDAECAVCGKRQGARKCARCMKIHYCSRTCQKSDWSSHKKTCIKAGKFEPGPTESTETKFLSQMDAGIRNETSAKDDVPRSGSAQSSNQLEERKMNGESGSKVSEGSSRTEERNLPGTKDSTKAKMSEKKASPDEPGATANAAKELHECKVCQKKGDDLEARVVYYCSIGCHEKDTGRNYPISTLAIKKDEGQRDKSEAAVEVKETDVELPAMEDGENSIKRHCDYCGRSSNTSEPCPNCGEVFYCSAACCKVDFPQHRSVCSGNFA